LKGAAASSLGVAMGGSAFASSAKSYSRILGANARLNVAIAGLGRRLGAFYDPIAQKKSNVQLVYLCDVMESQREKAMEKFSKHINYKPKLENDFRVVLEDNDVDVLINATPDHWHAPMACMAMKAGKHVYLEKPVSHNPWESEMLVKFSEKYDKRVQMGTQQRSSPESQEIIKEIHEGRIGEVYKAIAFYSNGRGEVPKQKKQAPPEGLDWELFQGPAPRRDYTDDTWNYNWHWYGWDYGTAETGNNATHELDVARWALGVTYPKQIMVEAFKRHFKDDGWEMYDTMDATMIFPDDKVIVWEGRSRNSHKTFGSGRGTVIYGTDGSVYVDRGGYKLFDRKGKMIKDSKSEQQEAGTALGGGGGMSTIHVQNFFDTVRGDATLNQPIAQGIVSQYLTHLPNIAYRVGKPMLEVDTETGHIYDRDAMKLWKREYEPGWMPEL